MALAVRIIPTLLTRGRQLVKGQRFNIYQARGVDELILLDIGATPTGCGPDLELVSRLTEQCFMPLTVGGGVKTLKDVRGLLVAGADKVAIKTEVGLISIASAAVGRQAIVAAVDYRNGEDTVERCVNLEQMGAGEILLTSIDREGIMEGYDLNMIKAVSDAVSIPVIAHGGCGTYAHMLEAIKAGASAVAAGAMFQFSDNTPRGAAEYLAAKGIEVRL
jgi:cyclase